MTKILKNTISAIVIFIFLLVLAFGLLVTFVSPNKIKPLIVEQVAKYSGRQLTMDGDLSWTIFPYLGVKIGHAELNNPSSSKTKSKQFIEIDHATVGVKLLPLLHSAVEFNEITLAGVKINLVKNADGSNNWSGMERQSKQELANPTTPSAAKKPAYSLQIPVFDIDDGVVTYTDLQTNSSAQLNNFEFLAKDISLDKPFTFSSSFDLTAKNPDAAGKAKVSGKVTANLEKDLYTLKDFDFTLDTKLNKKAVTFDLSADVSADLAKQTLAFTDLTSHLANLTLKGTVNVTQLFGATQAQGHLEAPAFDLKNLLQAVGKDNPNLQTAKNVTGAFDFSAALTGKTSLLQALKADGKIKVAELQAAKLRGSNVVAATSMQNGMLQLSSLTASLYQGSVQASGKVNLLTTDTPISFQAKLTDIQAEPLLADLDSQGSKITVKGVGNIDVQATTSGLDSNNIVKNLNGTSTFSFQNGVLDGINIGYYIDTANNFIHGQSPPAKGENVTNFGNLTGTAVISNGVVTNNDLALVSPRFDSKGQGTLNLVSQQINYNLQVKPKIPGQDGGINGMTIPITVTGSLNNPSINLDVKSLAQYVAKQKLNSVKDKLKDQLKGKAGDILGNFLGR
jgi:AsmA protein